MQSIAEELAKAGVTTTSSIDKMLQEVYKINSDYTASLISDKVDMSFTILQEEQIKNILDESQGSFTKLAYKNMGNDTKIAKELSSQLAQATMLGESQQKIISRIKKVTGQKTWQAKRVAQTERTRVQSQARNDTITEAAKAGVNVQKKWSTRMIHSRESHIALNGDIVDNDKSFKNGLVYPGDPKGSASEVINCRCVLIPIVKGLKNDNNSGIIKENSLQNQLVYLMNGEKQFIPKDTVFETIPKTIASAGTKREIDQINNLISKYGGTKNDWSKKVAKIESDKYIFDIHWNEKDGVQYDTKLSKRSDKK